MSTARAASLFRWRPFTPLGAWWRSRLARWIRRRQGLDRLPVRLERRRLYILPTRAGVGFGALLLIMLLAGLNYANSLALFFTFLLTAFALVVMQQCHRNLLGTEVTALVAPPVFAHSTGAVQLTLTDTTNVPRPRLMASLPRGPVVSADLPAGGQQLVVLPVPPAARGKVHLERFAVATTHPFGLFRAWTWVHTPLEMLVYPRPHGRLPMPVQSGRRSGSQPLPGVGADEWVGLRPFRDGDSPRQVDWKAYAREAPLLVKEYAEGSCELRMFDLALLGDPDLEARLSQLARWIVDAEAHGERYGLQLPGVQLSPDHGPEHRHRCLAALAAFGL